MTAAYGDVPLLDPNTGRFPDQFAPPSIAAAVTAAQAAALAAETAASQWPGVGPVTMPPGVPPLPCQFARGADGVVTHDMDFTPYQTAPTEIWVANTGNDTTGTGTQAKPYRTMYKAWDVALAAPGDAVIRTGEAFMDRNGSLVNSVRTVTDKRISVIGAGAQPTILSTANAALSWTDDGGAWKTARSGCRAVYSTALDDNGAPIPTPAATSLADCQATPNSWWTDNVSVWINTGGAAPTTATHHVCITVVLFDVVLLGTAELYVENITFLGGNENAVKISGSATSQGKFIANNVRFVGGDRRPIATGAFGNALAVADISRAFLFDCVAAYATRDGFNYHYPLVASQDRRDRLVVEYGCLSYGNGAYNTEGNNNATTAHEGVAIVRVNCEGHSTTGPVLADVQGCLSVLIDCWMHDSASASKELYLFADAGGEAWLYNCRAGGVGTYDLSTPNPVNVVGSWRGHRINAPLIRWLDA